MVRITIYIFITIPTRAGVVKNFLGKFKIKAVHLTHPRPLSAIRETIFMRAFYPPMGIFLFILLLFPLYLIK